MSDIERVPNFEGLPELYGASAKIDDAMVRNFEQRGAEAASLVIATLTETPYQPEIGGTVYGIEVSNVFRGYGDDTAATTDTVDEARTALDEFLSAKVPGSKRVELEAYPTKYKGLLKGLAPDRRTPGTHRDAFEQTMVDTLRQREVPVPDPSTAFEIVLRAPRWIHLLRLDGRLPRYIDDIRRVDGVTEEGHIVNVEVVKRIGFGISYSYDLPKKVAHRGGRAPRSTIVHDIEERVVDLRTRKTKR